MFCVDHDERRRKIAEVTVEIIAREGFEAATIRRIAAELDCSTTVITHYFADKQELLLWAYRALARQGHDRVDEVMSAGPADLVGGLVAMAAADDTNMRRWRVYVAFSDQAARDPVFADEQRLEQDIALRRIGDMVRERNGERSDIEEISRLLNALVQGISIQALVNPERWSVEQIRSTLTHQVEIALGQPVR